MLAGEVKAGYQVHVSGPIGWRTLIVAPELLTGNGVPDVVQLTFNGRTDDRPLVQYYSPSEELTVIIPRVVPEKYRAVSCTRCESENTRAVQSQGGHNVRVCDDCTRAFIVDVQPPAEPLTGTGIVKDSTGRMFFKLF